MKKTSKARPSESVPVLPEKPFPVHARPILQIGLAALIALGGLGVSWRTSRAAAGFDFFHYWAVPQVVHAHRVDNVYSAEGRRALADQLGARAARPGAGERQAFVTKACIDKGGGVLDTLATPFLFAVFDAASSGDYEQDHFRFELFSFAAFAAGVVLLCRLFGHGWVASLLLLALFSGVFEPFHSDFRVGNVNRIQMVWLAAVVALLWRAEHPLRSAAAGLLSGLAVAFKPNLGPAVLFAVAGFSAARAWKPLFAFGAGAAAGAGAAFGAAALTFDGLECWRQWIGILPEIAASRRTLLEGNFGLAALVHDAVGFDVSWLILLGVLAAAVIAARKRILSGPIDTHAMPAVLLCAGCAAVLLASRLVWLHYFLLGIPLFAWTLRPVSRTCGTGWVQALLLAGLAFLSVIPTSVLDWPCGTRAVLMNAAVIAFLAAALRDLATKAH